MHQRASPAALAKAEELLSGIVSAEDNAGDTARKEEALRRKIEESRYDEG